MLTVMYRDHQGQLPSALELQYLYHSWIDTAKNIDGRRYEMKVVFPGCSGNAEYYHSKLLEHLEHMREIRVKIEVNGKSEDQILNEFLDYQPSASLCKYQSAYKKYFGQLGSSNTVSILDLPQHWHLSNHLGYNLDRPQEFFKEFGDLTLTMLKMVRQVASYHRTKIPPLDTFEILWGLDPDVTSNHITKETIDAL
ncbi:MAG: hypothetical protein BYD32DRAFT_465967 [Podila humilis]|nr:MAG: hypothetical protein BYD32DRAFT_465967 [Podila humilis]